MTAVASPLAWAGCLAIIRDVKVDEIRRLLHAQPFRPFIIHVADGGSLLVKHMDFVALAPSGCEFIVYRHDRLDDYQVVNVTRVTRLEVPAGNGARRTSR